MNANECTVCQPMLEAVKGVEHRAVPPDRNDDLGCGVVGRQSLRVGEAVKSHGELLGNGVPAMKYGILHERPLVRSIVYLLVS